jgi:ribonuclease HI
MELHVFTDGACKSNGKHGAKASYAGWFPSNKELSFSKLLPEDEPQTNQRAELRGIHDSVKILYDRKLFDIHLKIFKTNHNNSITCFLLKVKLLYSLE